MTTMRVFAALAVLLLFAACKADSAPSVTSPANAAAGSAAGGSGTEPYVVSGRVTDTLGQPLAGVEVFADHTMYYNANIFDVTGDDGRYRILLGESEPSSWRVAAYIERSFEGRAYRMRLHEVDKAVFAGRLGAVRDLQWRLSGSDGSGGWYGEEGHVYLQGGHVDSRHVVVTFKPIALIDGSRGPAFTRVPDSTRLNDLPVGRYVVSVEYAPPGGPVTTLPVRERFEEAYAPSIEVGGKQDGYGRMDLQIEALVPGDPV